MRILSFSSVASEIEKKAEECDRVQAENGHEVPYEISLALIKMPSRFCILSAGTFFRLLCRPHHHRRRVSLFIMSLSINKWFILAKNSAGDVENFKFSVDPPVADLLLLQLRRIKLIKLQFAKRIQIKVQITVRRVH